MRSCISLKGPCQMGCAAGPCYYDQCQELSRQIMSARPEELNTVYATGMNQLGQDSQQTAATIHSRTDHGAGELG